MLTCFLRNLHLSCNTSLKLLLWPSLTYTVCFWSHALDIRSFSLIVHYSVLSKKRIPDFCCCKLLKLYLTIIEYLVLTSYENIALEHRSSSTWKIISDFWVSFLISQCRSLLCQYWISFTWLFALVASQWSKHNFPFHFWCILEYDLYPT